ncbi:MAG: (2Fe-2S) ferredoxin domain-containing protein [Planctomycetota bacterium]
MKSAKPEKKIRSLGDLQAIKQKVKDENALREDGYKACVTIHMGTCGIASGAREILTALMDELAACGRHDVRITTSGCIGACSHEPVMTVEVLGAKPVLYGDLNPVAAGDVFREHVLGGRIVPQFVVTLGTQS